MTDLDSSAMLALCTSLEKAIKDKKSDARFEVQEHLADLYSEEGVDRINLRINGQNVGTASVTYSSDGVEITNEDELMDFALTYGFASMRKSIKPEYLFEVISFIESEGPDELKAAIKTEPVLDDDWENQINIKNGQPEYLDSGLTVPGVEYRPKQPKNMTVRGCEPEKVGSALRGIEGSLTSLFLGGSNE